ncbi:hypothetical protein BSL78_26907 [Apostichopus japonicus]|uniref:WW domain-containing protein n=1 Tax=Stichopus japonicus TaxID=307972 RepID=A0A2G8JKI7_STIJA|nr:hypothetical protein BSL78_26907 [Apostichopus japonicus]
MQGFNQPKSLNENLKASSSSSSKSQLRNNPLSLQHQSLLDYEGINTAMPSEFDELNHFGHHAMPENPASIGAYAQSETFSWADDLFLLGEGTSNDLMHHPEIVGTIDEPDGTSSNLPNSSSSKSFKRRKTSYANQGRDIPGTSSTESSISQPYTFSFVESTSSSMPSPFSFDESDSDIDQCTSSSELCVIKQNMTLPVVVKEELSDKQPDHRQRTSQQPASTDKVIPCITSERSSLKLDTFLKTEVLERDNLFDTDSECSQEELLLKETAETTGFSKQCHHHVSAQHMDADLVQNSLPSTTIVYTGTQNTCASSKQQLLILAPVISSLDSLDDTNSTPVTSYSHKIPNATADQVDIPEGLVSSGGHSALSNMDTEWRSTCTSLSDKPTSDVFELFEQSGQDGHSTTTKTLSSVKPSLNQRLSKGSQKERPIKAYATSITLPKDGDCIEQFDLPRKDLKGELDLLNQTNFVLKAANPLSERLPSRQWASGRPDTNLSSGMKSSASPSTLTPLAMNTHNKGSSILDKEQVVLPLSRQNDIKLVENVDHFVKGNLEQMDTLNSKETSEQNLLSSTNLSGVERGAKETTVSGGTQNSNKTGAATQQDTLLNNAAVNKQSLPSVQEKTIMSENQDLLEEMNTEEDKSPKPASALHLPNVSNQNEQEEEAVGIKEMEMHSDDSDIDIDIDDLLEKELRQQVDNKGKKRTVNGEEKNNDVFVRSKVREPAEEDREQGVISVRDKIVLKKRGREPLEGLPENWMSITHRSGIDVYIHKPSRVCTWSRPYFLGPGSVRKHKVPLASIPCLHYKRAKEEEATSAEETAGLKVTLNPPKSSRSLILTLTLHLVVVILVPLRRGLVALVGSSTAQKGDDRFKNKLQMRPDEALEAGELHSYAKKLFDFEEAIDHGVVHSQRDHDLFAQGLYGRDMVSQKKLLEAKESQGSCGQTSAGKNEILSFLCIPLIYG